MPHLDAGELGGAEKTLGSFSVSPPHFRQATSASN